MAHYFITGASGVVGSALVSKLLKEPSIEMSLLMRAASDSELAVRRAGLLSYCAGDRDTQRVRVLRGDVSRERLGLKTDDWSFVTQSCSHFVHCAADVNLGLPLERALSETLAGAKGVIKCLEESSRAQKLEYVSTVGVGGCLEGGVPEDWISISRKFRNSYEEAKAAAEDFVRQRVADGLPITVHRPSMVVGDSASGRNIRFQVFYYLAEFLSGRKTFGFVPDLGSAALDIIPCDYVAALILWSSSRKETIGRILHACSGEKESIGLNDLGARAHAVFTACGKRSPARRTVPLGLMRRIFKVLPLVISSKKARALKSLDYFLPYLDKPQHFENKKTTELLQGSGLTRPAAEDYVTRVLEYYCAASA